MRVLYLVLLVSALVIGAFLAAWLLPPLLVDPAIASPVDRQDALAAARDTVVSLVAGVAVLVGAVVAALGVRHNRRLLEHSRDEARAAQQQHSDSLALQRKGLDDERFSRAVEQLSHRAEGSLALRLGAIFTLQQLAQTAPEWHWPIMEMLTAYVREHAPRVIEPNEEPQESSRFHTPGLQPSPPPADIQAIMTVVARRDVSKDPPGARLDLRGVDLRSVDLRKAQLENARLGSSLLEATVTRDPAISSPALRGADLRCADLRGSNLRNATLGGARLEGAALDNLDQRTSLAGAVLASANLQAATLVGVDLTRTVLAFACLRDAILNEADLTGADVRCASLHGTAFSDTDLRGLVNLSPSQLKSVRSLDRSQVPEDDALSLIGSGACGDRDRDAQGC